jgi:hypothetical protein
MEEDKRTVMYWFVNHIFIIGGALFGAIALLMGNEEMAGTLLTAGILLHIFF